MYIGREIIQGEFEGVENVPILGFLQTQPDKHLNSRAGRIIVYGDSNCLDNSNNVQGN